MATNNDGHLLDSAGNVAVDFVYGNMPPQPNDVRVVSPSFNATGGGTGDHGWGTTTDKSSARLDFTIGIHDVIAAEYAGYPRFTPGHPNFIVTDAHSDGTTVTYVSQNRLVPGQSVSVSGLSTSAFNLSGVTVATATPLGFTVTNAATGAAVTGGHGRAEDLSSAVAADDGAFIAGTVYSFVPSVVGLTTALATDALVDSEFVVTPVTTTVGYKADITNVELTANVATITASNGFVAGDVATLSGLTTTDLNGTHTIVTAGAADFTFAFTHADIVSAPDTGLAVIPAKLGTVKTQSPAAGAGSIAIGSTVTITSYAAA